MKRVNQIVNHLTDGEKNMFEQKSPVVQPAPVSASDFHTSASTTAYAYERDGTDPSSVTRSENFNRSHALRSMLKEGILEKDATPALVVYDLDCFKDTANKCINAPWPKNTIHAMACKCNPLSYILKIAKEVGLGSEAASVSEMMHAIRLGYNPQKVVFDSPVKTSADIRLALSHGVLLNADNLQEVQVIGEVIEQLKSSSCSAPPSFHHRVGLRINPQSSAKAGGSITSSKSSKFGVPLKDRRQDIIQMFLENEWLNGVHMHCGSQGVKLSLLVSSARTLMDLVREVNVLRNRRGMSPVCHIDLGGGVPADYTRHVFTPLFHAYATELQKVVPELWSGEFQLYTEFGRSLNAKAGFAVSYVQYTKESGQVPISLTHLGTDFNLRGYYAQKLWMPALSVYSPTGVYKDNNEHTSVKQDVGGPLCFSGDLVAKGVWLPTIKRQDIVMVHDVGAYTYAMWSRFNSRPAPSVYGFSRVNGTGQLEWVVIKQAETIEKVLEFWG